MAKRAANDDGKKEVMTKEQIIKEVISFLILVLLMLAFSLFWRKYITKNIEVISGSMRDTLQIGDRLVSSKLPYIFGSPKRGDVVVFLYPDDETQTFIKRLIGLPGETVEIVGGYVYVDGVLLDEDYVKGERRGNFGPYEVPEGGYFMLGDNRLHSGDSREWNDKYVSKDQIVGKALFLYKPKLRKIN